MRIAVTSQNFKTITGHAGKARRFIIYEKDANGVFHEIERLDMPKELSMHEHNGSEHPLFNLGLSALITQGAGQGFIQRMAYHGITVHVTSELDPMVALNTIAAGQLLPPPLPHEHERNGITMTEAAAIRVKNFLAKRGKGIGLRLGVRTSGCSGLAYIIEFVDSPREADEIFENQGIKIFVDAKSIVYLDGTELDYAKDGLNEGFKFNNPNVKNSCGCGDSFNV